MGVRSVRRAWLGLVMCACAGAARADDVPVALQDTVEAAMALNFIRPQTTVWRFDGVKPYVLGDRVVCGYVNFQTASAHYLGYHQFYAVIHEGTVALAQIDDPANDSSGQLAAKLRQLCGPVKQPR